MLIFSICAFLIVYFYYKSFDGPEGFANSFLINNPLNAGFSIVGGSCAITREDSFRHFMCCSITGGHKSTAALYGSLMTLSRRNCSIIVLDPGSVNFTLTSGFLSSKRGRKIYCFDLSDDSACFNPLHTARTVSDIERIIHCIVENGDVVSSGDRFWSTSCEMVAQFFAEYLFFFQPREVCTLTNIALLFDTFYSEPEKIDARIIQTNNEAFINRYKTINALPEKVRDSVLAVCIAAFKVFKSPDVARCTRSNSFSFQDFRKENTVLFLGIPITRLSTLPALLAVFFETFMSEGMEKIPERKDNPIFLLIDEAVLFKFSLGILLSQSRKYKIGVCMLIQSPSMFIMRYSKGETSAILSNIFTVAYLPGQDLEVCKDLKEITGRRRIEKDDKTIAHGEYLLEPSEIRVLEKAVIVQSGRIPLLLKVIPYFTHITYSSRSKIPPHHDNPKQELLNSLLP